MLMEDIYDLASALIGVVPLKAFHNDVNSEVDYAFIDEIFHFPQCLKYCEGDFKSWDPKITTPPGLYYLAYWLLGEFKLPCSLENMRLVNFIGGLMLIPLTWYARKVLGGVGISTLSIYMSPLIALYYSLFYTDVWASVFVLAAYVVVLGEPFDSDYGNSLLASLVGLISIGFRQTNIVWNAFITAALIDRKIQKKKEYKDSLKDDITVFVKECLKSWYLILPSVINLLLFCTFVYYNKGVTFGDQENHVAVLHFVQVFYCFTFILILTGPIWGSLDFLKNYFKSSLGSYFGIAVTLMSFFMIYQIIDMFTIIHPFIVADNRHYTFYIVRKIIMRTATSRYTLIPVYHFACYTIYQMMKKNISKLRVSSSSRIMIVVYFVCVVLVISPSPLFEPRYFILPFIFWRLMVRVNDEPIIGGIQLLKTENTSIRLILEIVWSWMWTQAIYSIFLTFKFRWEGLEELQRIIW
ncbi:glycosyltransferase family 59 protein [[Candida] arabinofermentans NRRL YB-2248]|uniref:Dol-P-Glc:Glc(2)Man(9)GlcNAc(2)-PP-Dol alpha-1,2-glucosyltransferase n=1 Tax=[Candida] arabinofermentans NRRL YB-2248 TaxID=983967 RepID=A0A1E4T3Y0_9ASCO|nr:glycosyltransferase family 59 protein [[Candida] arabinofermentans NRRL YB-2248]